MGQHKHNPTAIAAKNGELPPKKRYGNGRFGNAAAWALGASMIPSGYSSLSMPTYDPNPAATYRAMNPRTPSKFHK